MCCVLLLVRVAFCVSSYCLMFFLCFIVLLCLLWVVAFVLDVAVAFAFAFVLLLLWFVGFDVALFFRCVFLPLPLHLPLSLLLLF